MPLLDIKNLKVGFPSAGGVLQAVDGVTIQLDKGDILGIVGESGSGKSVAMMAMMGLVPFPGKVTADTLTFEGRNLLDLPEHERRRIVGKDIAMIFQEPATSLNPCFTVGFQLMETLRVHEGMSRRGAMIRAIDLLDQVGIPAPESRLNAYPHQLSGGMNQRVMIAIAIACNPKLLIADEPTTALDVTIQAQILDLLLSLQRDRHMALILITHNMGVVADTAERVAVMYAGQIVEERDTQSLFRRPQHPYSAALLKARPEASDGARLATIPGMVPGLYDRPRGCLFSPRCGYATARTEVIPPELREWQNGLVRCHYPLGDATRDARIAADRLPASKAAS
jgi:dipeptide transport system ATP-binding protein